MQKRFKLISATLIQNVVITLHSLILTLYRRHLKRNSGIVPQPVRFSITTLLRFARNWCLEYKTKPKDGGQFIGFRNKVILVFDSHFYKNILEKMLNRCRKGVETLQQDRVLLRYV